MDNVSRRDALRLAAAGAALVVGGTAAQAQTRPPGEDRDRAAWERAREAARRNIRIPGRPAPPREASKARQAWVLHSRSWDKHVYLWMDERTKGFVEVDDRAFAIAAACEAADRPVAVTFWGYDPNWSDGSGHFDGVLLAMDARDFP